MKTDVQYMECLHGSRPVGTYCARCLQAVRERARHLRSRHNKPGLVVYESALRVSTLAAQIARRAHLILSECEARRAPAASAEPDLLGVSRRAQVVDRVLVDPVSVQTGDKPFQQVTSRRTCTVYLWGYGPIRPSTELDQFAPTEEAHRFATERGWCANRPGAWAMSSRFPLLLNEALAEVEEWVLADHSIHGWGGRTENGALGFRFPSAPTNVISSPDGMEAVREVDWLLRAQKARAVAAAECRLMNQHRSRARQLRERIRLMLDSAKSPTPLVLSSPEAEVEALDPTAALPPSHRAIPPLPPGLFKRLNITITEALHLATRGRLADAYSLLLESLHVAEEGMESGEPWSAEMVEIYGLALDNFVSRFGVLLE